MGFEAYLDEFKIKHVIYIITSFIRILLTVYVILNLNCCNQKKNTVFTYYYFDIVSIRSQSTGIKAYLDETKKHHVHFHYHLKCYHITDNAGDIKVELLESNQNTVFTYHYFDHVSSMTIDGI